MFKSDMSLVRKQVGRIVLDSPLTRFRLSALIQRVIRDCEPQVKHQKEFES